MKTKEEMIDAIREKVIMANNPECKTLEEALEKESSNSNCIFAFNPCQIVENSGGVILDEKHNRIIYTEDTMSKAKILFYKNLKTDRERKKSSINIIKTLGLPITLERLLITLNSTLKDRNNASTGEFFIQEGIIGKMYIDVAHNRTPENYDNTQQESITFPYYVKRVCWYDIKKSVESQSEETISKIAEILGYKENE